MITSTDVKFIVKVADFGMSRFIDGSKDYYKSEHSAEIPVKWTARICILVCH
jgi:hypothetical protein